MRQFENVAYPTGAVALSRAVETGGPGLAVSETRDCRLSRRFIPPKSQKPRDMGHPAVLLHRLWVSGEVYEPLRNSKSTLLATA